MGIRKSQRVIVGALFGADNMLPFVVERDNDTIWAMREKCVAFWNNHVLTGLPPDPVNMADMMLLLSRRKGTPVDLSPEVAERVYEIQHIRNEVKMLGEQKEACEWDLFDFVRKAWNLAPEVESLKDDAILRFNGNEIATWKSQTSNRIDSTRLKKEQPSIAELYSKESISRVLRMK